MSDPNPFEGRPLQPASATLAWCALLLAFQPAASFSRALAASSASALAWPSASLASAASSLAPSHSRLHAAASASSVALTALACR